MKQLKTRPSGEYFIDRVSVEQAYLDKYYNLFMNSLKWEGIDDQQIDYIMRKFWSVGTVASFIIKGTKGTLDYPNGMIAFTPYAPTRYNIYDYPIEATLVNTRGVDFIPLTPQKINETVVIGFAQRNKKGIRNLVNYYIRKIVNIEMTIQINLIAQKCPWLIGSTPESSNKMEEFWRNLLSDNPKLFATLDEVEKAKALVSGAPYTIDKLYNYKIATENELREYLGLGNLGVSEKKEHLITAEVESNDDITYRSSECILNPLQEFCDRINKYFGYNISVGWNNPDVESTEEITANDEEEEDYNE